MVFKLKCILDSLWDFNCILNEPTIIYNCAKDNTCIPTVDYDYNMFIMQYFMNSNTNTVHIDTVPQREQQLLSLISLFWYLSTHHCLLFYTGKRTVYHPNFMRRISLTICELL